MNTIIEQIRVLIKTQIRREELNFASLGGGGQTMNIGALEWVLKQLDTLKEQPVMIQWTGNNLKEVIEFTGKSPRFNEWFKTWDEYESYVHSHGDIFKLFNEDGTHLEVPVGAWIFKTPDGQNVPSTFVRQEQSVCESVEHKNDIFEKAECWVSRNYPFAKGQEFDRLVTVYISGVAEGERRAKEIMLKDAVEGVIDNFCYPTKIELNTKITTKGWYGDKVKLVIIKED